MTVKHRIFLSFADEKRWLENMNRDGYELMSVSPFTYTFEKTDTAVFYEYIPLSRGRKSFKSLDYKKKDRDMRAVYANSEMALFKKPLDKDMPKLMSVSEKLLAFAKYRVSLSTYALVFLAVGAIFIMLGGRAGIPLMYAPAILFVLLALNDFYRAARTEQYIKTLR